MPFNGSGTFIPPSSPTYPAVDGTTILASQFNDALSDVYTGLSTCLTRDGQGVPSGSLPMNGYKHTGAAAASATGQYLVYAQTNAVLEGLTVYGTNPNILASSSGSTGDFILGQATSDASDNRRLVLRSGGAATASRGAFIVASGNEESGNPGRMYISAGEAGDLQLVAGASGGTITLASNTSINSSATVNLASGIIRQWTSADTDIDSLISGSVSGFLIEGMSQAHLTCGIRSNDANDGFQVISKSAFGASYDKLCFEVKATGNVTVAGTFSTGGNLAVTGTGTFSSTVTASTFIGDLASTAQIDSRAVGFRDIPATTSAAFQNGRCWETAAGITLNTADMVAGYTFCVYNNSGAAITITQGGGVTLYLAGTALTGNRTLAQRGWATIRCRTGAEAVIMGSGVS